jgi:hypothetical protein
MRNKFVLFSVLAGFAIVLMIGGIGVFALTQITPVQADEATLDAVPVHQQVEPVVETLKPVDRSYERVKYAGKTGGCSYQSAQQLMVEAPVQEADDQLLTLAQAE